MIATLSTGGQFLYANPAWKRCFGLDNASLLALDSFEELFGPACRSDVTALFRRALNGEMVDRYPLRSYTGDGRVLEFELSLSQRQKAGNPLAVRCLLRDVTQQKAARAPAGAATRGEPDRGREQLRAMWRPCAFWKRSASRRAGTWLSSGKSIREEQPAGVLRRVGRPGPGHGGHDPGKHGRDAGQRGGAAGQGLAGGAARSG